MLFDIWLPTSGIWGRKMAEPIEKTVRKQKTTEMTTHNKHAHHKCKNTGKFMAPFLGDAKKMAESMDPIVRKLTKAPEISNTIKLSGC